MSIHHVYVERQVANHPQVLAFHAQHHLPFEIIDVSKPIFQLLAIDPDPIKKGKELLFLTRNKGAFIKNCPGTRFYTCCGYKILHIGTYCSMDCSYCILQAYFHPPVLQYFVNQEDLLTELQTLFNSQGLSRIGTGEFTDSLIWEKWFPLSEFLIPRFGAQSHAIIELKTKTAAIDKLEKLRHNRKTIVAWSLNTPGVIRAEEHATVSLEQRLGAAAKCQSWGYPLAFHFDPILIYDGCEEEYRRVIESIFRHVSPHNIAWISLGTFRFIPALKPIIQKRFPVSKIVYAEFVPGLDGKMRYFKPLRIKMYRQMVSRIQEIAPQVLVYLCMEDSEVWSKAFGFVPAQRGGLSRMLDLRAAEVCGLKNV